MHRQSAPVTQAAVAADVHQPLDILADLPPQIALDGVLQIRGDGPLSVCYASAAQPVRARITDHLWLNYLPGRRTWKPGQEVSHWKATMECTK